MYIPTFVFIFILFLKNILLLLLYPKHVIKLLGYNLGCYRPYVVMRVGETGSYAIDKMDGTPVPRMWNSMHLRRYYQ